MAQSIAGTKACADHARLWDNHKKEKSKSTLNGIQRLISRPGEVPIWNQRQNQAPQQHDEEPNPVPARRHYFSPNRFYCVKRQTDTRSCMRMEVYLRSRLNCLTSASLPLLGHPCWCSTPKWIPHHLSNALSTGRAKRPFVRLPGPNRLNRLSPFRGLHLRSILHLTRANRLPRRCVILRDL